MQSQQAFLCFLMVTSPLYHSPKLFVLFFITQAIHFCSNLLLISMVSFSHIHGFHLHTIHKCMSNQSSLRPTRSFRTRYNAKEARARCGKSYIYIDTSLTVHVLDSEIVALSSDALNPKLVQRFDARIHWPLSHIDYMCDKVSVNKSITVIWCIHLHSPFQRPNNRAACMWET